MKFLIFLLTFLLTTLLLRADTMEDNIEAVSGYWTAIKVIAVAVILWRLIRKLSIAAISDGGGSRKEDDF